MQGARLLRNDHGVFVPAPPVAIPAEFEGHMEFADIDRDGDPDGVTPRTVLYDLERHLENTLPPRLGYHGELTVHVAEATGGPLVPVILGISLTRLAVPRQYGDWGLYWIDPTGPYTWVHSTRFLAAPEDTSRYLVPATPGLLGARVWMQGVVLHRLPFERRRFTNPIGVELRL